VITEKSSYQLMKHQILYQVGYFLPFRSALLFPTVSAVGEIWAHDSSVFSFTPH